MANAWFRMYSEFAHDPKVQTMPVAMQRHLVMLFCLRCEGKPLRKYADEEIAYFLQVTALELPQIKSILVKKGFILDSWELVNWEKRQYLSDSSTERVRQYRERQKQIETLPQHGETENVTAPETEQIQKQIQKEPELTLLSPTAPAEPTVRPEEFANIWNRLRGKLPKVERFTESRKKKVKTRMNEGLTLERFTEAVENCRAKPFLTGDNERGWVATFDWLMENDKNIEKAINNPYGLNKPNGGNHATVLNGTGNQIVGVVNKSLGRTECEDSSGEDGDLPPSIEVGRSDAGNIHTNANQPRFASFPSRDEEYLKF